MLRHELEAELSRRLRAVGVAQRLLRDGMADRASVSVGTLTHVEHGSGARRPTLAQR